MTYVPSIILSLFSLAFLSLWGLERRNHYTAIMSAAFLALGLALLVQNAGIPAHVGQNHLLAGFFWVIGILLVSESVLQRSGRHFPRAMAIIYLVGILAGLWYFFYVDRNVIMRICIGNFGLGLILLQTSWHARFLLSGRWNDEVLFWIILLVGAHMVPRVSVTIGMILPATTIDSHSETVFWQSILFTASILGVGCGLGYLVVFVTDIIRNLRDERDIDPLTGVFNRRGLERRVEGSGKRGMSGVMAVCDLDKFKFINDTYGHDVGDRVLRDFANIIRQNICEGDIVARTGGEEFVIVLRDVTDQEALALCESIRTALERTSFLDIGEMASVTCSFGVIRFDSKESLWTNLKRADNLLYEAKRTGRNCTCAEWIARMRASVTPPREA